ncbi:MAG: WD40 repeat domain-containing protein [Leptolyngbyaceae bacterium]|nr:WD40 repeat domain-containing protein [Leptolyngbyaceae bacterium]
MTQLAHQLASSRPIIGRSLRNVSVAFNRQGTLMASAGGKEIHLWDMATGRIIRTLTGHTSQVASLRLSPKEDWLISGSSDYTARLWDLTTGQTLHILQGHTDWVRTVAVNATGRLIATARHDATARLWDGETGDCLHCFADFGAWVWSVDFHPVEPYLAIASGNQACLFDLTTYECLHQFQGHTNWIRSLRFSPDGRLLATGSQDGHIYLWDWVSQTPIQTMTEPENRVLSVCFSPDSQTLVSTSAYETLKIWQVATGQCLHTLKADSLYEGMNITGVRGVSAGAIATLKQLGAVEI